jgi:hypothetical protein
MPSDVPVGDVIELDTGANFAIDRGEHHSVFVPALFALIAILLSVCSRDGIVVLDV